jgi:hypothetical protein
MVEEVVEAINPSHLRNKAQPFDPAQEKFFRFIPVCIGISLESLESAFFFLHRATISNTDSARITERPARSS